MCSELRPVAAEILCQLRSLDDVDDFLATVPIDERSAHPSADEFNGVEQR